jgi:hypothetical protein
MRVNVVFKDGRNFPGDVEGYAIGDPPGMVQIIYPDVVRFYPIDLIDHVIVPNLHAQPPPEEGSR